MADKALPFMLLPDEDDPPPRADPQENKLATDAMLLALRALSQRAVIAFHSLFTLLLAGSAFALWWRTLPDPSVFQLVGLSIYAAFVLALHVVRKH
jgi:hypothetical protein